MIHNVFKGFQAQTATTDDLMTVFVAAEGVFRVIEVDGFEPIVIDIDTELKTVEKI